MSETVGKVALGWKAHLPLLLRTLPRRSLSNLNQAFSPQYHELLPSKRSSLLRIPESFQKIQSNPRSHTSWLIL